MGVRNDSYYKPDEALHELMIQEQILNTAIDIQSLLGLLVYKEIITKGEIDLFREKVKSIPKYKTALSEIDKQKRGFEAAKENPAEYLKAVFNAKMNGTIK